MTRHDKVVIVSPPPDCDVGGVWVVDDVVGDRLVLRQGCSVFSVHHDSVRPATWDEEKGVRP